MGRIFQQDSQLFEKWKLQSLLDELDTIEVLEAPEHSRLLGKITRKQTDLYQAFGVPVHSL